MLVALEREFKNDSAKETQMAGEFDKDFGYLMPFLDKIGEAAKSLSNPAAREELRELIAGEKGRWARIRDLLADRDAPAKAPSAAGSPAKSEAPLAGPPALPQFTVGSLKGRGTGVKG
jgi:hypothetical protein